MTLLCSKTSSITILLKVGPTTPHMLCFPCYFSDLSAIYLLFLYSDLIDFLSLPPTQWACSCLRTFLYFLFSLPECFSSRYLYASLPLFLRSLLKSHLLMRPYLVLLSKISASTSSHHFIPHSPYLLIHLFISKSNTLPSHSISLYQSVFSRETDSILYR